ncbi:GTP binding protein [Hyaloraphidium curvatum]|nr:GTP binding protein [Hyaloraphidium curvatum]
MPRLAQPTHGGPSAAGAAAALPAAAAGPPPLAAPLSASPPAATSAASRDASPSSARITPQSARSDSAVALDDLAVAPANPRVESADVALLSFAGLAVDAPPEAQIVLSKDQLLSPKEDDRLRLVDMLKQRVSEGMGECTLEIGTDEEGRSMRLTEAEFDTILGNVHAASDAINCDATVLHKRGFPEADGQPAAPAPGKQQASKGRSAHLLVRQRPGNMEDVLEIRIAVVGNVDAGKSTLLGVLTKDVLDDGRGKARVNLFKHKHEIETGRTSSVGLEIMGFDSKGTIVTPHALGKQRATWEEICAVSSKVISFIDLAGHERYLKTTVFGMSGSDPHFVMLMVGANSGMIGMSREHLGLALCLNLPVFVVVTKTDMAPKNVLESTLKQLHKILKSSGCRKLPMAVNSMDDVLLVSSNFVSERICPIFQVSNVTGEGLPLLKAFMNVIHSNTRGKYDASKPAEFHITDTFSVPGVGTVVSGTVMSGIVHLGDTLMLGPDSTGQFVPTQVKSIQRKRVNVPTASAGQSASFALKRVKRKDIRKGMVMISKSADPRATREFEAEVAVLFHSTTISNKYQAMLHSSCIRQTVKIVEMDRQVLRTGDRALIRFRFIQFPEFLRPGARILLREGRTKCVGKVTKCFAAEKGEAQAAPVQFASKRVPPNHPAGASRAARRRSAAAAS